MTPTKDPREAALDLLAAIALPDPSLNLAETIASRAWVLRDAFHITDEELIAHATKLREPQGVVEIADPKALRDVGG